jgi:glycosyltransferase involved in cell wall biosynthesis
MHFALVIPELHKRGGTERCVASLAEALVRRGHRFTVFANQRDPQVLPSAKWRRVPIVRRPHIPRFFSFMVSQELVRAVGRARGDCFDAVLSTGPDVLSPEVTVFHCSAAGFAQLAKNSSQQREGSAMSRLKRWNSRLSYRAIAYMERQVVRRGARRAVAISGALKREFEHFHGPSASRLQVIADGVDLADFFPRGADTRARLRADLRISPEQRVVLFVGHNWFRKGLPTLVEAMRHLRTPNALLLIAGAGDPAHEKQIAATLGSRVRFLGVRSDMAELYACADSVALPTLHEPFGLPILEAMACGVPVVVSKVAGVSELISDGIDGLLLDDANDATALAGKLDLLLATGDFRDRIASAAITTAARFSWDALAPQFEALCEEAIADRSAR